MDFFLLISEDLLFSSKTSLTSYFTDLETSIENTMFALICGSQPRGLTPSSHILLNRLVLMLTESVFIICQKGIVQILQRQARSFFYDLMFNAIIQFFGYRPSHNGLFLTDYTSTWLKKDYKIRAPYIDTRLNETLSLAIQDFLKFISFPELENYHFNYADFLVEYANSGKLLVVTDGAYFFQTTSH